MACILCGTTEYGEVVRKGEYSIVKCAGCGFVYVSPLPSPNDVRTLYDIPESAHVHVKGYRLLRNLDYRFFAFRLKRYFPRNKKIRLLEIGCSRGDLLYAIRNDRRMTGVGVELNKAAVEDAVAHGLDVRHGTLEAQNFPAQSFDAVAAIHVIEHLGDPLATMREVHRILAPGGLVVSVVPCVTHFRARMAGNAWKYYAPPAHLWYFSPETFDLLHRKTGFATVTWSTFNTRGHLKIIGSKT